MVDKLTLSYLVVHGDCQCPMGDLQITLSEVPQAVAKSTMKIDVLVGLRSGTFLLLDLDAPTGGL